MATYLTGSQDVATEVGIDNGGPSDVTTQTGEYNRIVRYYRDAYIEVQNRTKWRWLRHPFTFNTVADDDTYAYTDVTDVTASATISRFGEWLLTSENTPKAYLTSSGVGSQYLLIWMPWDYFSQVYKLGTVASGAPAHITVDPQNNILIGPPPSAVYTITGEYYRSPQILAADGDTPEMPTQYHNLIMYGAMKKYAMFESAPEVDARATFEYNRMLRQLENNQGPSINFGPPLC